MTTPPGDDGSADRERPQEPPRPEDSPRPARHVRRHAGLDQPAGRWARPDSERDELWGDAVRDASEQLRREVPPHHGA